MNTKAVLLTGGLGLLAWNFFKSKADAWEKVIISFQAFKITGFSGLDLQAKLTVSLNNPTGTTLSFSAIEGTISDLAGNKIGRFSNQVGASIAAGTITKVDVILSISVTGLAGSILDTVASGYKQDWLIDSITTVGAIKLPVRQVFKVDFSAIKDQLIQSLAPQQEQVTFDLPAPAATPTPTITQPELFTYTLNQVDNPQGFISANAVGDIDPTGGVVITLPPPDGINPDQFTDVKTDNGYIMALPGNISTYTFNPSSGYTIGARHKSRR